MDSKIQHRCVISQSLILSFSNDAELVATHAMICTTAASLRQSKVDQLPSLYEVDLSGNYGEQLLLVLSPAQRTRIRKLTLNRAHFYDWIIRVCKLAESWCLIFCTSSIFLSRLNSWIATSWLTFPLKRQAWWTWRVLMYVTMFFFIVFTLFVFTKIVERQSVGWFAAVVDSTWAIENVGRFTQSIGIA